MNRIRSALHVVLICAAAAVEAERAFAAPAPAGEIAVTVVEVAGTQAYLKPGAKAGIRRGARVTLRQREYTVVQATDSFAAIVVAEDAVHEKDVGRAVPAEETATKVVELSKPRALSTWQDAWPDAVPPASTQQPRFVPLGDAERDRRWDVRLYTAAGALLPLGPRGSNLSRVEIGARVHAEPFAAPAAFDADVAVQRWFDPNLSQRSGGEARPLVYVRELLASYRGDGFYAGVGRMRYAASTLGTLDGARASGPLGSGFSIGAFGGLLPNPLSGAASLSGNRFGVEATYNRPDAELRPSAALVAQGSTFDGKFDERRISGIASLFPGRSRLGAHFEVSAFDTSNPWKANPVELTQAGIDSSLRFGQVVVDGRFDLRQPERSRWLGSYLPLSYFCTTVPAPAGAPAGSETCDGRSSTAAYGLLDVGLELDRASFFIGGTAIGDLVQSGGVNAFGGFAVARVVRIADLLRIDVSGNFSKATYVDMIGGAAGPGFTLFGDVLDLSVYYRLNALEYRSTSTSLYQHAGGWTVILVPDSTVLVALQGEAIAGNDMPALVLFGTATWRPRL